MGALPPTHFLVPYSLQLLLSTLNTFRILLIYHVYVASSPRNVSALRVGTWFCPLQYTQDLENTCTEQAPTTIDRLTNEYIL